jgi:hypothetical protein
MMTFFKSSIGVFLIACAGAGTAPVRDDESPRLNRAPLIRTDRSTYKAAWSENRLPDGSPYPRAVRLQIGLRYTNSTNGPIYLPTCRQINPPILEKKQGNRWIIAFAPVVLACLGEPEVIQPGKTLEYQYRVEGFEPGRQVMPEFVTDIPGTYRVVWDAYETWTLGGTEAGPGLQLPLENRISNEFEITE